MTRFAKQVFLLCLTSSTAGCDLLYFAIADLTHPRECEFVTRRLWFNFAIQQVLPETPPVVIGPEVSQATRSRGSPDGRRSMATVRYFVTDVDQAVAFYSKQLDFTVQQQFGPNMAILRQGDLTLWLAGANASASRPMPDGRKPEPGGWNRFVLEVADLAATVTRLKSAGVRFRNEIVSGPGGQQILAEDPFGNVVELFQPA